MPEEEPLLLQTDAGPTLHWRGLDFYPRTDPVSYARRKARVHSPLPRSLYFVPSLGLGHGLPDLLEALPADCAVLCVEVYQEVMRIAAARGIPRHPRLLVVRTEDPEAAAAALRDMGTGRFRRVVEAPLSAGYRLAPELYARIRRRLEREVMRYWQNRLTLIAMGSLQVRNVVANLPLLRDALDFSALSTTLPVVVAGAGPSLAGSLPVLARNRDRFVLVAVDTALPTLTSSGIAADVVVALEAQAVNNQDFIGVTAAAARTVFACDLSVHPSAARLFADRICFFSSEFAPLRLWERLARHGLRPQTFPALGSVGVAAAHAALRITRESVFLTGLDLSFPGSKTHAGGSPPVLAMLARSTRLDPIGQASYRALADRRLLRLADKHGLPILTDRVLSSYRDSLAEEISASAGRVLDCSETGLPLGVSAIPAERFEEILQCIPSAAPRLRIDQERRFAGARLAGFVAAERSLLADVVKAAAEFGTSGEAGDSIGLLLAEADYTWAHFPDVPDLSAPDRGFVARARIAVLYYAERLRRIESVL
ncbi:MAG: 6-hydroxymethylpterin diphosphokinase MptE-like protein [Spirochaetia bacterium]|jgi:hypothetical protein